jgi:benzylsuccinate CoA-transferase BbsE subunit
MSEPAVTNAPRALDGVRVLELDGETTGYAGRLFGDLGADVISIEPPGGGASRSLPPHATGRDGVTRSLHHAFVGAGKRAVTLDLTQPDGQEQLLRLADTADIMFEGGAPGALEQRGLGAERLKQRNPDLVVVSVTPFGQTGPHAGYAGGDLVSLATGGLLHLGGYHDVGPIAVHGRQSHFIGAIVAAVAALLGLLRARGGSGGAHVDVSIQEAVALALEDSLAEYELNGRVRPRLGGRAREAGTGTYPCRDGYVTMVAGRLSTGRSWTALVSWLVDAGVADAEVLLAPEWEDFHHRGTPEAITTFERIFGGFAATRAKADLYREGQRRNIAIAPVNTIADVAMDPQLRARSAFVEVPVAGLGTTARYPVPPYRLSLTPPRIGGPAPEIGEHNAEVLRDELGLTDNGSSSLGGPEAPA